MAINKNFIMKEKLIGLVRELTNLNIDIDAIGLIQQFGERYIADMFQHVVYIAEYKDKNAISLDDVLFVLEKQYDFLLCDKSIMDEKRLPNEEFSKKMSDIYKDL